MSARPADEARSWPALLATLLAGHDLAAADTAWAMAEIMTGDASPARLSALLMLLRAKGETPEELAGLVQTMRERATPLSVPGRAVDVVGPGAARAPPGNISTMAARVVAGAGRRGVQHGNRAASSTSELGVPTAFNFLGPLTNPARVTSAAIGCADSRMAPVMAAVLAERGDSALVFRGDDGLDELTTTTTSAVWVAQAGTVTATSLDPSRLGISPVPSDALRGGDRVFNASVVRDVLGGGGGPVRDAVLLNAAAGIAAHDGLAGPLEDTMALGLRIAAEAVDSGSAAAVLDRWVAAAP